LLARARAGAVVLARRVPVRSGRARLACGLLLVAAAAFVAWPRYSEVPATKGMSRTAARALLLDSSLEEGRVTQVFHDTVPVGAVVASVPDAGSRTRRGTGIALQISRGPQFVEVPKVTGMPLADAKAALEKAGFRLRGMRDAYSRTRKGSIVEQTPARNEKAPRGSAVDVVVSKGSRPRPAATARPSAR
jgi:serine/threonine-protein kinase